MENDKDDKHSIASDGSHKDEEDDIVETLPKATEVITEESSSSDEDETPEGILFESEIMKFRPGLT